MPQMMPMYWMILMFYFLLIFLFFNFFIYFFYINFYYLKKIDMLLSNKVLNILILNQLC